MVALVSEDAAVSSLKALCAKAESDVLKTQNQIEKLQRKLEDSKSRLVTLKEALDHVTQAATPVSPSGMQEAVDLIIASAGASGISFKDVHSKLEERGFKPDGSTVHVAATRLVQKGIIEIDETGSVRILRRKSIDSDKSPDPTTMED